MEKIDIQEHGIPEDICNMVRKSPNGFSLKFCIELEKGPFFKPYLLGLMDLFPEIKYLTSGALFYFGTTDDSSDDKLADLLAVRGYEFSSSYDPDFGDEHQNSSVISEYPWDEMQKVGDNFFVIDGNSNTIAVLSHHKSRATGKVFRTNKVSGGVVVVLVDCPDAKYQFIVRK